MPATQDIVQMAVQLVHIQPLEGKRYLKFTEWNGSKRVDLRFWKDRTVPTKEGVSLHLDQWKALCNMTDAIDEFLNRVIEKEQDWRYYIGNDVFVTINAPFPCVHISKHFIPSVNGPTVQPTEVWRKQRTETDHPIVGGKRDRTETVSSLA